MASSGCRADMTFSTVLVANRGEIAIRVLRAAKQAGCRTVAVFSDPDSSAPHLQFADTAVRIGPAPPIDSYLSIPALLEAADHAGADAVHPGYGFLSENAAFSRACGERGITFIGPPPEVIEMLGRKDVAATKGNRGGRTGSARNQRNRRVDCSRARVSGGWIPIARQGGSRWRGKGDADRSTIRRPGRSA